VRFLCALRPRQPREQIVSAPSRQALIRCSPAPPQFFHRRCREGFRPAEAATEKIQCRRCRECEAEAVKSQRAVVRRFS